MSTTKDDLKDKIRSDCHGVYMILVGCINIFNLVPVFIKKMKLIWCQVVVKYSG